MRILVVEDDVTLADQLAGGLRSEGYAVDVANDGEDGLYLGQSEPYDAVVLDLGLPEIDGLTILKSWRKENLTMPVLVLTARDTWHDKVEGIDAGADDYVAKPFHIEEVFARIRALVRRSAGLASNEMACGSLSLNAATGRVTVNENAVKLTAQEFKLLSYMLHHQGNIVSRTELTEHLYDQDFDKDSNTIEVFIARLRKKLAVPYIHTVRGLGYRLDAEEASVEATSAKAAQD